MAGAGAMRGTPIARVVRSERFVRAGGKQDKRAFRRAVTTSTHKRLLLEAELETGPVVNQAIV